MFLFKSGHKATRSAAGLDFSKSYPSGHVMFTQASDINSNHERHDAQFLLHCVYVCVRVSRICTGPVTLNTWITYMTKWWQYLNIRD